MKKLFTNLLLALIPNKKYRKKIRSYINKFNKSMFKELNTFKKNIIKNNTVLLFEPNDSHAEVIIGYAKYLSGLGYNIDILTTKENIQSRFFISFVDIPNIKIFIANEILYKKYFKLEKIKNYEFIWFTSTKYYANKVNIINYLGFTPEGKHKTLFTIHDTLDFDEETLDFLIKQNQIVSLSNFTKGIMVNPHYFCKYSLLLKNVTTTFITIGAILEYKRNYVTLFSAIRELILQNYKFKIIMISRNEAKNIPEDIKPYIIFKQNLNFPDMYNEIIKSDFFLPLLDPNNKDQERYITTGTTGSVQLIYGFSKPCLIHEKFAKYYLFDEKNSIIYKDDFYTAMLQAINMSKEEYKLLQKNISIVTKSVQKKSINNLTKLIKSI